MLLRIAAHIVKILGITNPFADEYPEYVASADFSNSHIDRPAERGLAKVIPLFPDATSRDEVRRRLLS